MANKKPGEFAALDEDFMRAPIAQPAVPAEQSDINLTLLVVIPWFSKTSSETLLLKMQVCIYILLLFVSKDLVPVLGPCITLCSLCLLEESQVQM